MPSKNSFHWDGKTVSAARPDCARCGFPYHRHNIGTSIICPIIPTYVPKDNPNG